LLEIASPSFFARHFPQPDCPPKNAIVHRSHTPRPTRATPLFSQLTAELPALLPALLPATARQGSTTLALALALFTGLAGNAAADEMGTEGIAACTDFDRHVNGAWEARTELPADRARIGSFNTLADSNNRLLDAALAELVADPKRQTTPGLKLLAAYYRSGMDLAAIEQRGLSAVQPWLDEIARVDRAGLPQLLGRMARLQVAAPLAVSVGIDAKDVTRHLLSLSQSGLGLPNRDDYFEPASNTRNEAIKADYRRHVQTLLRAASAPHDTATLDLVMAFETALAEASMNNVQRRDPKAIYNPHTAGSLAVLAPGFDWQALLQAYTGRDTAQAAAQPLVLGQPAFAQALARLSQTTPLDTWRAYLRVRLLDGVAAYGPRAVAASHFQYHEATLRGLKAAPPRHEELVMAIGGRTGGSPLGQTLGELFVASAFTPQAQQRALQMVDDIKEGMRRRLQTSPWMSPATQAVAVQKLDAMALKIGAPPSWKSYDGLALQADDYAGNLLRVAEWATADRLPDLDRPVDRARWNTSPHIVNAFAASGNQIVFPAGILQPPFFDARGDDASNYGAIGMVIGHEIIHHFDDRGRQFDAAGNLRDWWSAADVEAYKVRASQVAALYGGYQPLPGQFINGRQTLGENISDVGGMQIAYEGLQIALARQKAAGTPAPVVDGATPEQRFFRANAIVWRGKYRAEAMANQLRTGQHSPGRWRILGPMSNMTAFAQAFDCKPGDAMVAANPIVIW
jgi:predicted metalloendopeptidase